MICTLLHLKSIKVFVSVQCVSVCVLRASQLLCLQRQLNHNQKLHTFCSVKEGEGVFKQLGYLGSQHLSWGPRAGGLKSSISVKG